jgi:signal transduction histidine kinase
VTALCLLLRDWQLLVLPVVAVLLTLLALGRFALQPLAGLAGAAQTQRDRVVAAADAERMRLASVLHDGPLADVTLLIQRLDDRGDADSAAIARSIATELRAIGSELRLPVLDDLGTGPALEWLVGRLAGRSGAPIALDQRTLVRPPAEVELAMYRVAQEALVNALKHGLPPVRVAYVADATGARLAVDDAGPGIRADAQAVAEHDGRLGRASMAQRAETIGARLALANRPEGGARVTLAWRAPVPVPGLVDAAAVPSAADGLAAPAGARVASSAGARVRP